MQYYPRLDLLKFCCCIGIVFIHTVPFADFGQINERFLHLQPIFVAMFFIISSSLFWPKMRGGGDAHRLWHFSSRLLILATLWGILLLPHWLPKFIRHNEDTWQVLLLPKILLSGFCQGSWFIMSLVYGVLICYLLNRFLNRHVVFVLCASLWLYLSLVFYEGMTDYLHIYFEKTDDSFGFESYFSPVRSLVWIEAGYYLVPIFCRRFSSHAIIISSLICLIAVGFLDTGYFVANGLIAVLLPAWAMKKTQDSPEPPLVTLRQMSIVVFFIHFVFVTIFHVLFTKGIIGFDKGLVVTLVVLALSLTTAYALVRASRKYRWLRYLY